MPAEIQALVPLRLLKALRAVPLARENVRGRRTLVVAMSDPGNLPAIDELAFATGMRICPVAADEADIGRALDLVAKPVREPEEGEPLLTIIEVGPAEEDPAAGRWVVPLAEET